MIDLNDIAVEYNVLINDSVRKIKVIDSRDLYEATKSLKDCSTSSLKKAEFMASSIKGKCPSPYHITWYSDTEINYSIIDAVLQAEVENNNIVVIEILPNEDPL